MALQTSGKIAFVIKRRSGGYLRRKRLNRKSFYTRGKFNQARKFSNWGEATALTLLGDKIIPVERTFSGQWRIVKGVQHE